MGVVSLLVSDIVGSTALWAEDEQAMAGDLAAHDELVQTVVDRHRGSVVKHTGDGALAAFDDPVDALGAAVTLQRGIEATSWRSIGGIRVRVAVHCGTVIARGGDLFGTPVNRAVRLLGVCPAGAIVVSSAAAALLGDRSLDEVRLRPAGRVSLRGLSDPEDAFAVVAEGVVPIDRLDDGTGLRVSQGLPVADDVFVGRQDELAAVAGVLGAHHVASIVGVGGMGKSRLALEAARRLRPGFPAGTHWCDLAAATSPDAVVTVVLDAVGAARDAGRPPVESVVDRLRPARCLLVLDNCEHVLGAVRALVTAIRAEAPDTRLLLTSREAVGLRGEHIVPLGSLPAPDALELFVARVRDAGVEPTDGSLASIERICERLDGIPLALELAAARCRTLDPAEIEQRLDDRFRLLRGGRPGVERHRTLQAAVAWSYDLLDPAERDLFDRMAVFADGSLLDGVAAVGGLDEYDALDLIDGLVARSMLTATSTELGTRYRQLETLRQFAEDRLVERGLLRDARDRHLAWCAALAESIGERRGGPEGGRSFRRFVHELDNIRVAVTHALSSGQRQIAYDVLGPVAVSAWHRLAFEVLDWIELDDADPWTTSRARLVGLLAMLRFQRGDVSAPGRAVASVPEHLRLTDLVVDATFFDLLWSRQDFDAAARLTEEYRRVAPVRARALELFTVTVRQYFGSLSRADHARAVAEAAATVEWFRQQGDEVYLASVLTHQAVVLVDSSRALQALDPALEALELSERLGCHLVADSARAALARAFGESAADAPDGPDRRAAAAGIRHALVTAEARGNRSSVLGILSGVSRLLRDADPATAYLLRQAVVGQLGGSRYPVALANQLGPEAVAELDARAPTSVDEAVALALAALDRHVGWGDA